jgi:hypothetical protein
MKSFVTRCEVVPAIIVDNPALKYVVDYDAETGIVLYYFRKATALQDL